MSVAPLPVRPEARLRIDDGRLARIALPPPIGYDRVELVRLCNAIAAATGHRDGAAVQFAGLDGGAAMLAYHAAWIAATTLGRRTLLVGAPVATGARRSLGDVARGLAGMSEAIVQQGDEALFFATLQTSATPVTGRQCRDLLDMLGGSFELILIATPPVLAHPLAGIVAGCVDGSVLVLEAGTARSGACAAALALLTSGGRPVLGAVLDGERNPVPGWLRKWF